jgi:hypothetical protein
MWLHLDYAEHVPICPDVFENCMTNKLNSFAHQLSVQGQHSILTAMALLVLTAHPLFDLKCGEEYERDVKVGVFGGSIVWKRDGGKILPGVELGIGIRMELGEGFSLGAATSYSELRSRSKNESEGTAGDLRLYPFPLLVELFFDLPCCWGGRVYFHAGCEFVAYDLRGGEGRLEYGRAINVPLGIGILTLPYPLSFDFTWKLLEDWTDAIGCPGMDWAASLRMRIEFSIWSPS